MQTLRSGRARLLSGILVLAGLTTLTAAVEAQSPISLQNLHTFSTLYGDLPTAPLVRDASGNFYGVAYQGGVAPGIVSYGNGGYNPGHGTVFELTSAGQLVTLHSFTGGADGDTPQGGLAMDSAGSLYGNTYAGGNVGNGSLGDGVVFKITQPGQTGQTFSVLHAFVRAVDGSGPAATPTFDAQGDLFGTTAFGGNDDNGTVWEIPAGGAFKSLYLFAPNGNPSAQQTGSSPRGDVVSDGAGDLFGTTYSGGSHGDGNIFEIKKAGQTGQSAAVLVNFAGGSDGSFPSGNLTWNAAAQMLFGTTTGGGTGNDGTVWQITKPGQAGAFYSVIHRFAGKTADGSAPSGGMVQDSAGTLYGATVSGGAYGDGAIFTIVKPGKTGQTESLRYSFTGVADASAPDGGLFLDSSGDLYGATSAGTLNNVGGNADDGTLFRLSPQNVLTTLARFTNDGYQPSATNLIADSAGRLYGVTAQGGLYNEGELFQLDTSGLVKLLHSFDNTDGRTPTATPARDAQGNLYGVTYSGDKSNFGNVWEVTAAGAFKVLHTFIGGNGDGANPYGLLLAPATGTLYGTTQSWGQYGDGTIFEVQKPGQTGQTYQTLYSFNNNAGDGDAVQGGMALDSAGALYGAAGYGGANNDGTVWKYTSAGAFSVLYPFTDGSDGANPEGGVTRDSAGDLLGTTINGGASNAGTAFKMTPADQSAHTLHALHSFGSSHDGAHPYDVPVADAAGNLYGSAQTGGANDYGAIWEITAGGAYQTLYDFQTTIADGYSPSGGLILNPSGGLIGTMFGTAGAFGVISYGTVFQINFPTPASLTPAAAIPGSPAQTLTVAGTGFVSGDSILWNGTALATTFASATSLTATIPASDLAHAGTAQVSVYDPVTNHTSPALTFQISQPNLTVSVSSVQRESNNGVLVTVVLSNSGPTNANSLAITSATLHSMAAAGGTGSLGSLSAGRSVTRTLTFPDTTPSGATSLTLKATYKGGSLSGTYAVTVP